MSELIRIGTAGWAIPRHCAEHFPQDGSGLERYAARFTAVEINSTFRRSHKPYTYARWAQAAPEGFRFAVKMPKRISHELKLLGTGDSFEDILGGGSRTGTQTGATVASTSPSLVYDPVIAEPFFDLLRTSIKHPVVCEPRHSTWFDVEADEILATYAVARAAADPARASAAGRPAATFVSPTTACTARRGCTTPPMMACSSPSWRRRYAGQRQKRCGAFSTILHRELRPRMPSRCKHSWSPTVSGKRAHDAGAPGQPLVGRKAQYRGLTPPGPPAARNGQFGKAADARSL